jgi:hypothetical protein
MAKVLTIRDPRTGALIAEEQLRPEEDKKTAVARVYRKALGPDAPELTVLSESIWLDDRQWAEELEKDWGSFGLALLGPKGDPRLEKSHLVLARVSDGPAVSRMQFPMEKRELEAIKHGRRRDVLVPVKPEEPPAVGDTVTFLEATVDPFGTPLLVPNGGSICVELTEVRNQGDKWVGQDLYYIAWDPEKARKGWKKVAAHSSN